MKHVCDLGRAQDYKVGTVKRCPRCGRAGIVRIVNQLRRWLVWDGLYQELLPIR